jgi:hypothetical protein
MEIQIEPHTLERAEERGATLEEIKDVIENGTAIPAKKNRLAKFSIYEFGKERNGNYYPQKKVEVYFVMENNIAVTITVYAFYGTF